MVALSAVPVLRDWVRQQDGAGDAAFALLRQYLLLLAPARGPTRAVDPRPVLKMLEGAGWKSRHAQDACETMARLLEIIEDCFLRECAERASRPRFTLGGEGDVIRGYMGKLPGVNAWGRGGWGRSPFSTITSSSTRCEQCGYISQTSFQQSIMLTLGLPAASEPLARQVVREYMTDERVEMRCEQCMRYGLTTRRAGIAKLPEVLVLHLQKAIYMRGMVGSAGRGAVFGRRLVLPVFADGGLLRVEEFRLRSVVRHHGTAGTWDSHFTALVGQGLSLIHI